MLSLSLTRLSTTDPTEYKLVKFADIHQMYARRYELKKFKGYMQTILKNYKNGTQQFEVKSEVEKWSTRSKKSLGWHLLYDLLIDKRTSERLKRMKVEEIHESNPLFSCYSFDSFKKYYKDMVKLTGELLVALS